MVTARVLTDDYLGLIALTDEDMKALRLTDADWEEMTFKPGELELWLSGKAKPRPYLTTSLQRRIGEQLKATPRASNATLARELGVTDVTVGKVRRVLEARKELRKYRKRIDPRTGKLSQPAYKQTCKTSK